MSDKKKIVFTALITAVVTAFISVAILTSFAKGQNCDISSEQGRE